MFRRWGVQEQKKENVSVLAMLIQCALAKVISWQEMVLVDCFLCCSHRGETALHMAACQHHRGICQLLVEAGASLRTTDSKVTKPDKTIE